MSSDPTQQPGGPATGPPGTPGEPTEEELRGAYEAELSRITPADMMLQAAVSLLNIGARRLHTILERVVEDISYEGPDLPDKRVVIDGDRFRRDPVREQR